MSEFINPIPQEIAIPDGNHTPLPDPEPWPIPGPGPDPWPRPEPDPNPKPAHILSEFTTEEKSRIVFEAFYPRGEHRERILNAWNSNEDNLTEEEKEKLADEAAHNIEILERKKESEKVLHRLEFQKYRKKKGDFDDDNRPDRWR